MVQKAQKHLDDKKHKLLETGNILYIISSAHFNRKCMETVRDAQDRESPQLLIIGQTFTKAQQNTEDQKPSNNSDISVNSLFWGHIGYREGKVLIVQCATPVRLSSYIKFLHIREEKLIYVKTVKFIKELNIAK